MDYIDRAGWGARLPKYVNAIQSPVEGIFIHYRGPGGAPADEAAALRQDQNYHMDVKGWSDIAYSWAVGNSGRIYRLRGWGIRGGHTAGWNDRSHAVLWIGGDDGTPSEAALDSIAIVVNESRQRYRGFCQGHRDVNPTSCPGDKLYAQLKAGRFDRVPVPDVEEEDDMPEPKILLRSVDANGASHIWLTQGITKVHVPSMKHVDILRFLGVKDATQGDSTKLLETLGTLPNGNAL